MSQQLRQAYANVRDYGARGNGDHDDTSKIQAAINTGKHVLFPQGEVLTILNADGSFNHTEIGPYVVLGPLDFNNDGQRCTFLSGAAIELNSADACVKISGKSQTFTGLRVTVGTDLGTDETAIPSPACVIVDGADGLLLEQPFVACGSTTTLVDVQRTRGMTIRGGRLTAYHDKVNTGLALGDGVKEFSAECLAIDQVGYGVILSGTTESISFVDCTTEHLTQGMIDVRGHVWGLSVVGMHMESGTSATVASLAGAYHFVVVHSQAGVHGAIFAGCEFGALRPLDPGTPEGDPFPRRVFVVHGEWIGVNVFSCSHTGDHPEGLGLENDPGRSAVYEFSSSATITNSGDMFNMWDYITVVTGGLLPVITTDEGIVLAAHSIQLKASRIGFFNAAPVARSYKYRIGADYSRNLVSNTPARVLASLLRDLARLGIIECEVR